MKRSGILVGGASAGRSGAADSSHLEVAILQPVQSGMTSRYPPRGEMIGRDRYNWLLLDQDRETHEDIGVWVHDSLTDRSMVMRALIEGYRPLARVER